MSIRVDPEAKARTALSEIADLSGRRVLEIGCGDGRFTWQFADEAEHVLAIDPDAQQIASAREQLPARLENRVEFRHIGFEDFAASTAPSSFDVVLLSWSLC